MKKTVTYDVDLIEYILQIIDGRIIPQMTFKNADDILVISNIINALREQGKIEEFGDTENAVESDQSSTKSKQNK